MDAFPCFVVLALCAVAVVYVAWRRVRTEAQAMSARSVENQLRAIEGMDAVKRQKREEEL